MIWISHATGNTFVRALLAALARNSMDYQFHSTLALPRTGFMYRAMPAQLRRRFVRRVYDIPPRRLLTSSLLEVARLFLGGTGLNRLCTHEVGMFSVDAIYRDLDAKVARRIMRDRGGGSNCVVHAYEDGARATFAAAKCRGIKCSYELPITYWETSQRLLNEEASRFPQWEPTLIGTRDSAEKLERKTQEMELSDAVICPSEFVYRSIPESVRKSKLCVVAEFGSPDSSRAVTGVCGDEISGPRPAGPLKILFAGSMTQRKGLADVFAAMRILNRSDVELIVMGTPIAPMEFYRHEYPSFRYEPPRAHSEVIELMQRCDVLVLPSIVEGRALVQQEALSCGLPIIVTANAGGEDLVEEGQTGFLVPIRSPEAIAEKINWFADHREKFPVMRIKAVAKARERSWEAYGNKIVDVFETLTSK